MTQLDEKSPLMTKDKVQEPPVMWSYGELLLPPIIMLLVGILVLSALEGWPMLTSAYVISQILTTIGYGGFQAKTNASKIFMAVFAVLLLFCVANLVGVLCDNVLRKQSETIRRYLRRLDPTNAAFVDGFEPVGDVYKVILSLVSCVVFVVFGTVLFYSLENCRCGMNGLAGCRDPDYATCVATGGAVKGLADAFFMSVMTLTTIGFGDYQPRTVWGIWISIPWMFCGVYTFANSVMTVGTFMYESRKARTLTTVDGAGFKDKSQAAFRKVDTDGKGHLNKAEFLAYTLLKYDVISEDLVEAIFKEYEHLDGAKAGQVSHTSISERQTSLFPTVPNHKEAPGV